MKYPKDQFLGLFFILFINDMPIIFKYAVNINLNLYADDTSLTIYADNNELLTKYLLYIGKSKIDIVGSYKFLGLICF